MRGHNNPVVIHLVKERNALLEFYQEARVRSAFRALAEVGLAVAAGEALRFATERASQRHSHEFLRRKGGSCDACTEAGIIARAIRALLVQP